MSVTLVKGSTGYIRKLAEMIPELKKFGREGDFLSMLSKSTSNEITFLEGGLRAQWKTPNGTLVTIGSNSPKHGDFFKHLDFTETPEGANRLGILRIVNNMDKGTYSAHLNGKTFCSVSPATIREECIERNKWLA